MKECGYKDAAICILRVDDEKMVFFHHVAMFEFCVKTTLCGIQCSVGAKNGRFGQLFALFSAKLILLNLDVSPPWIQSSLSPIHCDFCHDIYEWRRKGTVLVKRSNYVDSNRNI